MVSGVCLSCRRRLQVFYAVVSRRLEKRMYEYEMRLSRGEDLAKGCVVKLRVSL